MLKVALASLSEQQQKVYHMGRIEKIKQKEIAHQLEISVESVKKHMYLASKNIQSFMQRHLQKISISLLSVLDLLWP